MRKFLIIIAALFCFNAEAIDTKSAMTTAKFGGKHSCSLQYLGNNIFITAIHCVDFVFSHKLDTLNTIIINKHYGLFQVLYYTMDRGLTLTDGFALIEVFLLDFTNYETVVVPNEYTCLLYTSPSPRDRQKSRMPSSA